MATTDTDKRLRTVNTVTVSAVFLLVLLLSYFCPLITDDLHFKFIWKDFVPLTGQEVRVGSIADIFESARNYYQFSGGRVICHFLVFAMVNMNKWVFASLNAAMFVICGFLIYKHMDKKLASLSKCTLLFIYMTMFLFLPVWGDSILWISGSVNYLWSGTAMIWAIYMLDKDDKSYKNYALTCVAVLIASATNEISGGMMAIIIILRMLTHSIKPLSYYYTVLFCVIPGIGLVLTAPGNANRMAQVDMHTGVTITDALKTSYGYLGYFADWGGILLFPIFIYLFFMIFKKGKLKNIILSMTVTIACFAGSVALGFSGVVIQRALFITILPLMIPFWSLGYFIVFKMNANVRFKAEKAAVAAMGIMYLALQNFMQAGVAALILLILILVGKLKPVRPANPAASPLKADIILAAIMGSVIMIQTVMFFIAVNNYNGYIDQTVKAMQEGDNEAVMTLRPSVPDMSFFPSEGMIVSDYSVSWIYEYYVINGGN